MEEAANTLSDIVERVSSWIPRLSSREDESTTMSRDFWMPDRSCRMCYECDSQFTIFNRRHHCRICGRVFCGKCTLNTIPASYSSPGSGHDENERVRVCNFCFKLRVEQDYIDRSTPALHSPPSQTLSPSGSGYGFSKPTALTGTHDTHYTDELSSLPVSDGNLVPELEPADRNLVCASCVDSQPISGACSHMHSRDQPSSLYEFCRLCRSDDEEDHDQKTERGHDDPDEEDDSGVELDFADDTHGELPKRIEGSQCVGGESVLVDRVMGNRDGDGDSSLMLNDDTESLDNYYNEPPMYEEDEMAADESDHPIVDYENNGVIWVPPPPEDEEDDEVGMSLIDEDDEEAEWVPRIPGTVSSSENRSKAAMRAIIDGHFRALVAQLLIAEDVRFGGEGDPSSWLEIVSTLALQAANLVKPDTSKGGGMDPGGYVKVKCIASGRCEDSVVVKGIVCHKNVQNRRMTSRFKNPRLLLLGGALEYQRVSNQLSSLDTLLQQERDHLSMTVARIEAHHPNVLLVEKTVSRYAQDKLLEKEISVVLNVKRTLLERIARCTGAQIVSSPDNLMAPKSGQCELFHIEKFSEERDVKGQAGRQGPKYLMFFEGCPRPLGCTVLLKGASTEELKSVKKVVQFAVFAAYHLALETSFLADEGASLPELPYSSLISSVPSTQCMDRSNSSTAGFTFESASSQSSVSDSHSQQQGKTFQSPLPPQPLKAVDLVSLSNSDNADVGDRSRTLCRLEAQLIWNSSINTLGASEMSAAAIGSHSDPLNGLRNSMAKTDQTLVDRGVGKEGLQSSFTGAVEELHQAEQLPKVEIASTHAENIENLSVQESVMKDDFPPSISDHQSILISLSSRCLRKGSVCELPRLKRIKYYGSSDKPLGKFLKDSLFNVSSSCGSCEEPLYSHVHCYTHRQGSLTISVQRVKDIVLPGEKDGRIWMWHRCLCCPRVNGVPPATRRLVMSDAAWGLSFGKFLELSFSNHAAASRSAACGHSLHRDCLRFYGCGNFVACFRYATINLHSVAVPPPLLEFNDHKQQDWLKNEASEVADRGNLVFAEIFNALGVIGEKTASSRSSYSSVKLSEVRRHIVDLESVLQKEKADIEAQLQLAAPLNSLPGQPVADILALNKIHRHLAIISSEWDSRLYNLTNSLHIRQTVRNSDPGYLDDPSVLLLKAGSSSFGRSKEVEINNATKQVTAAAESAQSKSQKGQAFVDISTGVGRMDQVILKQDLTRSALSPQSINVETCVSSQDFKDHILLSEALSDVPAGHSGLAREPSTFEVSGVQPLLLDVTEQRPEAAFLNSHGLSKQLSSPLPFNSVLQDLRTSHGVESVGQGHQIDIPAIASLSLPLEGGSGMRPSEEGYSPATTDFSGIPEAVWVGSGSGIDVITGHEVDDHTLLTSAVPNGEVSMNELSQVVLPEDTRDTLLVLKEGAEKAVSQSIGPFSPVIRGKDKEVPDDSAGASAGTLSSLYKVYSQSGSTQSSMAGSPPKAIPSTPKIVSLTGHLSLPGAARLHLPPGVNDTIITVYDDEPTSIIAYALLTPKYQADLWETAVELDKEKPKDRSRENELESMEFGSISDSIQLMEDSTNSINVETELGFKEKILRTASMEVLNLRTTRDVKVAFSDPTQNGKVEFRVTCYYAKQFNALRKKCCGGDLDYIHSMSRCKKWGAHGGKSNVFFAKTLDDRFVVKQVTSTEKLSFLDFAPQYFNYLTESLNSGSPTCLAKIVGVYRVSVRQAKGNKDLDLLVMENLLYARNVNRLYDLKGSVRSRYNSDSTGNNKVLLDENLLEMMPTSPIFVSNKAKRLLERAVWNDTAFLAGVHVMDYSLLVGVDEDRQELVLGIIDFIRQYTWDKHLETWVKQTGILGGTKNATPTVISPKQYKKRFRKAMSTYFVMVPDQWTPLVGSHRTSEVAKSEDASSTGVSRKDIKP